MHLDIKPNNIMILRDAKIKLLDLGLARKFIWCDNFQCGTAGYIAPEILRTEYGEDRADVFSCGLVFYTLLSGCLSYISAPN